MERILNQDERIRRAEEIYYRRHNSNSINKNKRKEGKSGKRTLKKIIIQIFICLLIYLSIVIIKNSNYIFSEQFLNRVNEILSQDIEIEKYYNYVLNYFNKDNTEENEEAIIEDSIEENIGGAELDQTVETQITDDLSQMEKDALSIKNNYNPIKPLEGTITSRFGYRNPTSKNVPKNHTGIDIAATTGTPIVAVLDGIVELASGEGDYGNHLKIKIDDIEIVYAHCNKIYKSEGENIKQGEVIAEVGSTRKCNRFTFTFRI